MLAQDVDKEKLDEVLKKVDEERKSFVIYPNAEDVFRLFKTIDYSSVKIVIIGQDPYHNGNANGIAFACRNDPSPSLIKIGEAIRTNGYDTNNKRSKTLDYLIEQGVFLYNTILTVRQATPLSHKEIGWWHFTSCVINALNQKEDLVWMLWGGEAQSLHKFINKNHYVMKTEHPAAASRESRAWRCDHFAAANHYLKSKNQPLIQW